jgi:FkbM family methyltransferase
MANGRTDNMTPPESVTSHPIFREFAPAWPAINSEIFEWLALCEAILEARGTFTMFELGAGFGRWSVFAARMVKQRRPDLALRLVAVEGATEHFDKINGYFREHDLNPAEHDLIHGAITDHAGTERFFANTAAVIWNINPSDWYGQRIMSAGENYEGYSVPAIDFRDLLDRYDAIDLIDMDIQGAELRVVQAGIDQMTEKVGRIYVETHANTLPEEPHIHEKIKALFLQAQWTLCAEFDEAVHATLFGPIDFSGSGGTLYFANPQRGKKLKL